MLKSQTVAEKTAKTFRVHFFLPHPVFSAENSSVLQAVHFLSLKHARTTSVFAYNLFQCYCDAVPILL